VADYTSQIRRMVAARACVRISFSPADEKLAAGLFERQVLIEVVEHGIALGCTRKYMTLLAAPQSGAITSLGYFQHVIEEAATAKVGRDYWQYIRGQMEHLENEWRKKVGFSR
jgi:hypothetical protein